MKFLPLMLVLALAVPVQAADFDTSPERDFLIVLLGKSSCEIKSRMVIIRTAEDVSEAGGELSTCKDQAKAKASEAFKVAMAAGTGEESQAGMRKVYAAWLTALGQLSPGRDTSDSPAETALDQAQSELIVTVELR